jgi:putative membrane protein
MSFTSPPRRPARWLAGAAAIVLTALLAPASPARAGGGGIPVPATSFNASGKGAVSAADADLVIKVRLAGLWEIPAGNMAQRKSEDPRVRRIGRSIAAQHVVLDKLDRDVARRLGIELPNQPNSDQQSWLAEMRNANSATFDQIFIDRLRAAHGKIFPAIATIRASTRNDSVRQLAQQTNQFVMTHITLLESSGIVDYGALPTAPAPAAAAAGYAPVVDGQKLAAVGRVGIPGVSSGQLLLLLAVGLIAAVLATVRFLRKR